LRWFSRKLLKYPLHTIKHILARYTAFLWGLLSPLGVWGVFVIAALDGAAVGLPMDVVVAGYVYSNPSHFLLYALLASAGSAAGSLVIYLIGYLGGEKVLRKRISPERFAKIHDSFQRHPFWALMFPAMLPPPTPFKLFVLAAAVFEMRLWNFVAAIFSGRFVRFFLLSVLTIKFGPDIVHFTAEFVGHYYRWLLAAVAAGLLVWLIAKRRPEAAAPQRIEGD
jgi:membrane protein YqaA with SNARE-associated domain